MTTTNFADFGARERKMAEELLRASREQGFPDGFEQDGVTLMMNTESGNVFFTNEEFQVAMMNGDKLEGFYSCPYCGAEGFEDEIHEGDTPADMNRQCVGFLGSLGIDDERTKEAEEEKEDSEYAAGHPFFQGQQAKKEGKNRESNPYGDTAAGDEYIRGYEDAQDEAAPTQEG